MLNIRNSCFVLVNTSRTGPLSLPVFPFFSHSHLSSFCPVPSPQESQTSPMPGRQVQGLPSIAGCGPMGFLDRNATTGNPSSSCQAANYVFLNQNFSILESRLGCHQALSSSGHPGPELAFRLSGSSVRPAYPGFMVINTAQDGTRGISEPSNMKRSTCMWGTGVVPH